jgi:hypothetical protein
MVASSLAMGIISMVKLYSPAPVSITNNCAIHPLTCNDFTAVPSLFSLQRILVIFAHPDDAVTCAGGRTNYLISLLIIMKERLQS